MSSVYNLINHLVKDDMTTVKKLKKAELLAFAEKLLYGSYCEMPNACVKEEYQERFNTIVKGV